MKKSVIAEIKRILKEQYLNCPIEEIREKAEYTDWYAISRCQVLSEDFIRQFEDKVYWNYISCYQHLSENFIREFKDKVSWGSISAYQHLGENFIREFKDKVSWYNISCYQILSEDFIREFKDKVCWDCISTHQILSKKFIREFIKDSAYDSEQKRANQQKSLKQKTKEMKEYAERHYLKFDGKYLYAFREHDKYGHGAYNKTIIYKKGKYYTDWHCDMRKDISCSFGLGIWPCGNTPVKVKVEDWGVSVNRNDGKARVWGFEVISKTKKA